MANARYEALLKRRAARAERQRRQSGSREVVPEERRAEGEGVGAMGPVGKTAPPRETPEAPAPMGRRQSVGRREGDESGEPTQDRRQQLGRRAEDAEEAVRQALERGALDRTSAQGIFDIVRRGDVSEDALEELARALNVMAPPKPSAEQVGDEPDAGTVTDVIEQAAQQAAQESE